MGRLQTIINGELAHSIIEIDSGNLRNRKLVQAVLEGKLQPANNLLEELTNV